MNPMQSPNTGVGKKLSSITIGTCYFPSIDCAIHYYYPQIRITNEMRKEINQKIEEKLIVIGQPLLKQGETLIIYDGRYHIRDNN